MAGLGDLGLGRLTSAAGSLARDLEELAERAFDRHVRLAVTGLRRSGKTVFTTALVHHLLDGTALPFLEAVDQERYLGARLLPVHDAPTFPYTAFVRLLSDPEPRWPTPTEALSKLRLGLRFRTANPLRRLVEPIRELVLEVIDYPGEWLLDLPLMETDYAAFSARMLEQAERPPRAQAAREWLALARAADQAAAAEDATIGRLAAAYTRYLLHCQRELRLSLVQPGRFTSPGALAGSPLLAWAPLPPAAGGRGSLRAAMEERFLRYREEVVRAFYEEHFRHFDRQIVLVDLLTSLNEGPEHFADTQAALALVLQSFRYGRSSWLGRLIAPRIDRLLLAASKADHVAPSQHAALKQLLELMVAPAARNARLEGVRPEVLAIASLRCTDVVQQRHHGQTLSCLKGRLEGSGRETVLFPGEIPAELPTEADWTADRFRFQAFRPRRLRHGEPGQHIRLDQAIEHLLGDKLR